MDTKEGSDIGRKTKDDKCCLQPFTHHGGSCVTPQTIPQTVLFPDLFDKPLVATFDRQHASSDVGAVAQGGGARVWVADSPGVWWTGGSSGRSGTR